MKRYRPLSSSTPEAMVPSSWPGRHAPGNVVGVACQRAGAPALVAIFLVEMLWAVPDILEIPFALGVTVSLATLAIPRGSARTSYAAGRRTGRPVRPDRGAGFVLVPTVLVMVTPHSPMDLDEFVLSADEAGIFTCIVFITQLLLLAGVFALVVSGLGSLLSLLGRELISALSRASGALAAVIPIMLGFVFFFFFTGVWQAIANLDAFSFIGLLVFLLALGGGFSGSRRQFDLDGHARFETTEELTAALADTPLPDGATGIPTPIT